MAEDVHACFISYRHPASQGNREEKLIRHVVKAIQDHLEIYTHEHKVYFDEKRLVPGYQYEERLAEAICRSACMVVVYWPSYLESEYCKKEISTMLEIEKRRRQELGAALHGCRLFIPIILRGNLDDLPMELRDCHYLDYSAQATRPNFNIGDDEKMSDELYKIAKYVKELCVKMKTAETALFGECKEFTFDLAAQTAMPVQIARAPQQPFPGK